MAYTKYSLTPADNNAAPPNGAPEGMLPSAVNDTMRDMMAQIRDVGDGIRGGTYTMTAPVITGGSISGLSSLALTGVATFSAGSVSAPAITTTGDTNTGIYFPAADTIAFTEGGVEVMRINSSANVGIGIVNGTAKLTVAGANANNAGAAATFIGSVQINESGSFTLASVGGLEFKGSVFGAGYGSKIFSTDDGNLLFGNRSNSATWSERMRITSSGLVGIGTNSPAYQLEIKNSSVFVGLNSDGTNGVAESNGAFFVRTSTANPLVFGTNTAERMRIDSSGVVLIGSTGGFSGEKLRVNSSGFSPAASFTFSSSLGATSENLLFFGSAHGLSGALLANNNSVSLANASDYRLKTNINPLIDGLKQVLSLKPKEFEWLNSSDNIKTQGFIAHEVQEILPAAVFGEKDAINKDGTIKSQMMDATKFIPIIISSIQELKAELDSVKAELQTLKGN